MTQPDRVAPFLERLERVSLDDLAMVALGEPDHEAREALLTRVMAVATEAGPDRLAELRAAPRRARDQLIDAFARRGFEATWFGPMWGRSSGRADDRARILAAVEDAAVAEVMADLLTDDELAALSEPWRIVTSLAGAGATANPQIEGRGARGAVAGAGLLSMFAGAGPLVFAALGAVVAWRRGRRRRRGRGDTSID